MGSLLATPNKEQRSEDRHIKEQIYDHATLPNVRGGKTKSAPLSKFQIVQECFPTLAGKENKFFNEKVPSYWQRTKSDSKKSKPKLGPALEAYIKTDHACAIPRPAPSLPLVSTSDDASKIKHKVESTLDRLALNQPNVPRHSCSTLNLSETLKYIGCYVYLRCRNLEGLKPSIIVGWIRSIDRNLVLSGWQELGFISQPNMMVLYMLLREVIPPKVRSAGQLKAVVMSALYMCYAYNGHEISYPLKPFLVDGDRAGFWERCMDIISNHSDKMLKINKEARFYNEVQIELKTFGRSLERRDK